MFLFGALLSRRSTPGRQWIGKHRRVKKVTQTQKQTLAERERRMQQVLSRLSTPYLTEAEEHRHAQLRKAEQCREWREQVQRRRAGIKNITITPFPELQSSS